MSIFSTVRGYGLGVFGVLKYGMDTNSMIPSREGWILLFLFQMC